ncbi:PAS-domain containing protein [Ciceribacter azotifigens]|uniref:PAS-domain containing protein n=1 Tax=Ciceribacter azotifigens TaxID=2069303 RepID=UPI003A84384E
MTKASDLLKRVCSKISDLPDPACVKDGELRYVAANEAYAQLFGLPPEKFAGKTDGELFDHPAAGDRDDRERRAIVFGEEQTVPVSDGTGLSHRLMIERFSDEDGRSYLFAKAVGTHERQDGRRVAMPSAPVPVTKESSSSLHHQVESLLRLLPVGVLLLSDELVIEYFNDAFTAMLGSRRPERLIGMSYYDFVRRNYDRGVYRCGDEAFEDFYAHRLAQILKDEGRGGAAQVETARGMVLSVVAQHLDSGKILVTYSDVTALHRREQESVLYRTTIEQLPVPVFIRDSEHRFIFANKAYEEMHQCTLESVCGLDEEQMFPELGAEFHQDNVEVLQTGALIERAAEVTLPDSRSAAVVTRVSRIFTPDQTPYLVGSISDVTLLKAREQQLLEAQARTERLYHGLESVLQTMPVGVVVLNQDLVVEFSNPRSREIWAWPDGAPLEGLSFRSFTKVNFDRGWGWPDNLPFEAGLAARIAELRALDGTVQHEVVYPDGKQVLITTTKLFDNKILITHSDLTAFRRQEQEITETRLQLQRLGQFMHDATRVMSQGLAFVEDGVILQSNEALSRILNVPARLVEPGQSWHASFACCARRGDFGADPMERLRKWQEKIEAQKGFSEVFLADGKTWVQVDATVSSHGHWMLVYSDITEMKKREQELTVLLARSEAADKAKSEFLANMSHEIRTPMNGVLGMAELLAGSDLDTRQKTFVDIIVKSGNALLTIINDILDFSKIDAGQMQLRKMAFDPIDAVEDVATLLSTAAAEKDIELVVDGDAAAHHVIIGDAGRFRQIVTNLLGNAIKFTEKGHVLVALSSEPAGNGEVVVTLRIEDTGVGIPDDKRRTIFEKFSQADSSSTRRHEGTGLGLAITAGLVGLFGGSIDVESEQGRGSVFTVRLPFRTAGSRHQHRTLPQNIEGARVLVVDDNALNRKILAEQLVGWGFDGLAVDGGAAAVAILEEACRLGVAVDALVIDDQMPGMSGVDLARRVREDSRFAEVAIVFLTSMDAVGDERALERLKVDAQLMKPARSNLLRNAIIDVVRAARLRRSFPATQAAPVAASARPRSLPAATAQVQADAATTGYEILVAEDNEVNQIVFTQILQAAGLSFAIVTDGQAAVDAWERHCPRLILMDVSMPVMNGLQATQTIRERERAAADGRHVPIIGVTAHALDSDRDICLGAGMDDYLSKPVGPEQLAAKMERWLVGTRDGEKVVGSGA